MVSYRGNIDLGVTSLTPEKADIISKFEADGIGLSKLKSIQTTVLEKLVSVDAWRLDLSGLQSISKEDAIILSNTKVSWLDLSGLTSLDQEVLVQLTKFSGTAELTSQINLQYTTAMK